MHYQRIMESPRKKLKPQTCEIYTTDDKLKGVVSLKDTPNFDVFSSDVFCLPSITRLGNKLLFCDREGFDFTHATPNTYLTEKTWSELVHWGDTMRLVVVANMVVLHTQSDDVIIPTSVANHMTVEGYIFEPFHAAWQNIYVSASADVINSLITRVRDEQVVLPQFGPLSARICFRVTATVEFWPGYVAGYLKPQLKIELLCTAIRHDELKEPEKCIEVIYYPLTNELVVDSFFYRVRANILSAIRKYVEYDPVAHVFPGHKDTISRTLAGFAMEWVKAVAYFCDSKCIVKIGEDVWVGHNDMSSKKLSHLAKETLKVEPLVRRAARVLGFDWDWDAMNAYLQRVKADGFYGQFGFKGATQKNKRVNVTDMITLNASFVDLAL